MVHGEKNADIAPRIGQPFRYGFRFKWIGENPPRTGFALSQVWQRDGAGFIPLVIDVYRGRDSRNQLKVITKASTSRDKPDRNPAAVCEVQSGTWYDVYVMGMPQPKGGDRPGYARVAVRRGEEIIGRAEIEAYWGKRPGGKTTDRFDVRMGIYRPGHEIATEVFLDDCWYENR